MDWHELEKMKVDDLRALAKEKLSLEGVTGLHKDDLVAKLAEAFGIPRPHKVVEGAEKGDLKARIRELKRQREQALGARDQSELARVRREIHRLKGRLRRRAHVTH